jgi:hypothetical protein
MADFVLRNGISAIVFGMRGGGVTVFERVCGPEGF